MSAFDLVGLGTQGMVRSSGRADLVSVGSHGHFSGIVEEFLGILTDSIAATDIVLRTLDRNRLDGIDLSDNFIIGVREIIRLLSDPFALNDIRLKELFRQFADNFDTNDARLRDLARFLSESLDPNDEQVKELFRNLGERIDPSDQLIVLRGLSRLFANNIALNDFFDSERFKALFIDAVEDVIVLIQLVNSTQAIIADMVAQGVEFTTLETRIAQLENVSTISATVVVAGDITTEIKTVQTLLQKQELIDTATALFEEDKPAPALFELWDILIDKISGR